MKQWPANLIPMEKVIVFDTTLRDGEQACGCSMTVAEKSKMAGLLADLGVDVMEAGFPIASEGDFEAVRRISREVRGVGVAGLARAKADDLRRAAQALEGADRPRIHTFISTSPLHREHKLRMNQEQVLIATVDAVRLARTYVDDVEFSAEDAMRTEPEFLKLVAHAAVEAGARTINIPDTVGYTIPEEFGEAIAWIVAEVGDRAVVSVHCHNDLGLATANSLAGVQAGARQVECTLNGIGERAGNAALEEVVMALKVRQARLGLCTQVRTAGLFPASQALAECIGFGPQPNKAIVGRNAFAHEAGIHQDGVLKERTTYEIMDPRDVGVPASRLILGKHSGRHALRIRCEELGHSLDGPALERAYRGFISLADRNKWVADEQILAIAREATQASA
jgi:2-isopropylmalate synthase